MAGMRSQPQGRAVAGSTGLARGLKFAGVPRVLNAPQIPVKTSPSLSRGGALAFTTPGSVAYNLPIQSITSSEWTVACLAFSVAENYAAGFELYGSSTSRISLMLWGQGGTMECDARPYKPDFGGTRVVVPKNTPVILGAIVSGSANQIRTFIDRTESGNSVLGSTAPITVNQINLFGKDGGNLDRASAGNQILLMVGWDRALSTAEWGQFVSNPWQVLDDQIDDEILTQQGAPVGDTALAGTASSVMSAAGALSTSIPLSGTAATVVAISGTLTTQVRLAGAASIVSAAAGSLSTAVPLVGGAALQVSAAGALAVAGAVLTGTAVAQVSAAGTLSTQVRLAGGAALTASASGVLAGGGALLVGDASLRAAAAGALSTSIPLSGSATLQVATAGALAGSAVVLSGGASMRIIGTGALSSAIVLSGAAAIRTTGSGNLAGNAAVLGGAAALSVKAIGTLSVPANIDLSKISPARIVVFEGSGSRVTPFDSSGSRVTLFEGSGSKTVRFE